MINLDDLIKENTKVHNSKLPQNSDHLNKVLIIAGSLSVKTNALSNLINHQREIEIIFLSWKDCYEPKYQLWINKLEQIGLTYSKVPRALKLWIIESLSDIKDVYPNTKYWLYLII